MRRSYLGCIATLAVAACGHVDSPVAVNVGDAHLDFAFAPPIDCQIYPVECVMLSDALDIITNASSWLYDPNGHCAQTRDKLFHTQQTISYEPAYSGAATGTGVINGYGITLYSGAFESMQTLIYTLVHESAHNVGYFDDMAWTIEESCGNIML